MPKENATKEINLAEIWKQLEKVKAEIARLEKILPKPPTREEIKKSMLEEAAQMVIDSHGQMTSYQAAQSFKARIKEDKQHAFSNCDNLRRAIDRHLQKLGTATQTAHAAPCAR